MGQPLADEFRGQTSEAGKRADGLFGGSSYFFLFQWSFSS